MALSCNKGEKDEKCIKSLKTNSDYCFHHMRGRCRLNKKKKCRFLHPSEICENWEPFLNDPRESCGDEDCLKRHQKICLFHILGRCRFKKKCDLFHKKVDLLLTPPPPDQHTSFHENIDRELHSVKATLEDLKVEADNLRKVNKKLIEKLAAKDSNLQEELSEVKEALKTLKEQVNTPSTNPSEGNIVADLEKFQKVSEDNIKEIESLKKKAKDVTEELEEHKFGKFNQVAQTVEALWSTQPHMISDIHTMKGTINGIEEKLRDSPNNDLDMDKTAAQAHKNLHMIFDIIHVIKKFASYNNFRPTRYHFEKLFDSACKAIELGDKIVTEVDCTCKRSRVIAL